jgi:hypothetical protein
MRNSDIRLIVVIIIAVVVCVAAYNAQDSAFLTTLASMMMFYITFEFLLATRNSLKVAQSSLDFLKEQDSESRNVELHFDLGWRTDSGGLVLRVSNLGKSSFLVQKTHVAARSDFVCDYQIHQVVASGRTEEISLGHQMFGDDDGIGMDLQFTIYYVGLDGEGIKPPECFNVFVPEDGGSAIIKKGLHDVPVVSCPKCSDGILLNLGELSRFSEEEARRRELLQDLDATYPQHKSNWIKQNRHFQAEAQQRRY